MAYIKVEAPFKNAGNNWLLKQLFVETWYNLPEDRRFYQPVFSLRARPGFIDCRATFLEENDPTGYKWAIKHLKSVDHLSKLLTCPWFAREYKDWVDEIKYKLKAEAVQRLIEIASGDSPQALQASKYLAAAEWDKATYSRGRPSKEEMTGELKRLVSTMTTEEEDAERIGLIVTPGVQSASNS